MNIWLKRVSLILPPVIVAGVYFDKIPVGPGIRYKIDSIIKTEESVPQKIVHPIVEKFRGEVYMKELATFPPVLLKGGEVLKTGQSFATGTDSALLLSYRGPDAWLIKFSPDAQVNIDELMKMKDAQTTTINLMRGGLIIQASDRTHSARKIQVRTKLASFTLSNGTFAILTDGETRVLMTVQKGAVDAENFRTLDKTPVREAHTYFVNREGEKKVQLDLDALDLYNWDPTDLTGKFPVLDKVVVVVGDLGPTPDDAEKEKQKILKEIDKSILEFKEQNESLQRENAILLENAEQSRIGYRQEKAKLDKDIRCLETSTFECNLFSEKILLTRGFPRTWGNPQYRNSLVVGIGKYLHERNEEVQVREEEAKISTQLMNARQAVLRSVQADRASEKNLDKIIPTLHDERLRR